MKGNWKGVGLVSSLVMTVLGLMGTLSAWVAAETAARQPTRAALELKYPHFMEFLKKVDFETEVPVDPGVRKMMQSRRTFRPTDEHWDQFFQAAVADHLTNLRAIALLGLEASRRGVGIWSLGQDYMEAVRRNRVDLGLALPVEHVIVGMWEPIDRSKSGLPDDVMHLKLYYDQPYVHRFPDEVMPANLKVGMMEPIRITVGDMLRTAYPLEADLFYGDGRLGFRNVKGVSGEKRGMAGFFQKMFFFLPDAVQSMTLDEKSGDMITDAIVDTRVEDFETIAAYQMTVRGEAQKVAATQ